MNAPVSFRPAARPIVLFGDAVMRSPGSSGEDVDSPAPLRRFFRVRRLLTPLFPGILLISVTVDAVGGLAGGPSVCRPLRFRCFGRRFLAALRCFSLTPLFPGRLLPLVAVDVRAQVVGHSSRGRPFSPGYFRHSEIRFQTSPPRLLHRQLAVFGIRVSDTRVLSRSNSTIICPRRQEK